jgi:hypothetical protein
VVGAVAAMVGRWTGTEVFAKSGAGVEGFWGQVAFPLDGFSGAGGGIGFGGGGLEGVTGSSPGKDCFCCSGVSAEREREIEVMAESRRAETSVTSGSSDSLVVKLIGLWFRYSHRPKFELYVTDLSWYEPESSRRVQTAMSMCL